ncbi:phage tail protein [Ligaoa zhengdingensis]|uniref:phage tail protein n=2 Tax=Ligaoa zhengdingensis TaxID=2763658 RepID=UPI0031BB3056
MKQQLKTVNFYKCALQKGVRHGFVLTDDLTLRMESPTAPCAYITRVFDTGDAEMTFNRLYIEGEFHDVKLEVIAAASAALAGPGAGSPALDALLAAPEVSPAQKESALYSMAHVRSVNNRDILLHGLTGRYVWVYLAAYPLSAESRCEIEGFRLEFPKYSFTEYFPEIYQGDAFFDRYIAVLQSIFLDEERRVDEIPRLLDYEATPDETVEVLAGWLGVDNRDGVFSPGQLRQIIRHIDLYQGLKGTKRALEQVVELATGVWPRIVESFQWDTAGVTASQRQTYHRLYGETSNDFCVILDLSGRQGALPISEEKLERLIESYSMVGARFKVVTLRRCSHTDTHCYLDVNSALSTPEVASVDQAALGSHITVG